MLNIPRFSVQTQIYESANSLVYRARRESNNQPVILKILKENYPTPQELARYRTEYHITQSLDLAGVVKVYDLQKYQNTLVMSLEDFGGESLKIWMQQRSFSLEEFLVIAIATAETLGQIHAANIIHKDINPSNIVFNSTTEQLKIIDFGISTQLTRENTTLKNPNILEGTLAYMSPEQTGRMNRAIDYRTDFYSLGVTFYELLTGKLPFDTADALELVHCHIAKVPIAPCEVNPEVPKVVSDIVMKLMAKTAEERYQSGWGIKADLEECLNQLRSTGAIAIFPLGERDISGKFQLPQKLYGREREIEILVSAFERVTSQSEMILIAGYSGIGKTALVQEIYKPITEKRGYFISGKFDQYQRNIPYSAIVAAFRELVKQLLSETETQLNQWREKLLVAMGVNGQVIVEIIPEVELIIGKQTAVPELGPNESQNRFNLGFQNFVKVFTQPEHPLALFIDDLQWADGASLNLMQLLISGASNGLFLIGAYRDNEVSSAHPLMLTIEEITKSGAIERVFLSPLQLQTVSQFISDTLNCSEERTKSLAALVAFKTGGNPFFLNEFLKSLYTEGLLEFDWAARCWQWNLAEIHGRGFTDNVVELMAEKIQKLPGAAQQMLKLAACMGNQFDLETLGLIGKKSLEETARDLQAAVAENLLVPLGGMGDVELAIMLRMANAIASTEFPSRHLPSAPSQSLEYKFVHDRIQQAAYTLILESDRPIIHQKIGKLLLQNTSENKQEEKIFDIVNQLNFSLSLIADQSERDELAQLNLIAGKKAKLSTAYQPALNYLQVGIELLETDSWQPQYNLTLSLYEEAAEAAYLNTNFDFMESLVEEVLSHAKTVLDKVKVYELKILANIAQGNLHSALALGLEILKLLGVSLPKHPSKLDILWGLLRTKASVGFRPIASLFDLPVMSNPDLKAAMRILTTITIASIGAVPMLYPLIVFKMVGLSIQWGNAAESAFAYSTYGAILCSILEDIETGSQFGQLAINLLDAFNATRVKAKTEAPVYLFIKHWKEPLKKTINPLRKIYTVGLETGDLEFACYAASAYSNYAFSSGCELKQLESEMNTYSSVFRERRQKRSGDLQGIYHQTVLNLLLPAENPCYLAGKAFDERLMLPVLQSKNDHAHLFWIYFYKLMLCFLFDEAALALENAKAAEAYLDTKRGLITIFQFYFYESLSCLAVANTEGSIGEANPKFRRKHLLQKVRQNQKKMRKWARLSPMNHLQKYLLVEAEFYRVQGKDTLAIEYYDKAIATAKENDYVHEVAIAYELAAKFYLSRGKELTARAYIQEARYCYQLWGAAAKVKDLDARYPQLLQKKTDSLKVGAINTNTTTGNRSAETLDLATVMKASQAISVEIVLERLLDKLMKMAIENAGATNGFLILSRDSKLSIAAEASAEKETNLPYQPIELTSERDIPKTLINYVARTSEHLLFNDTQSSTFASDPYILTHQPKSVLCAPIQGQGKLVGILYLENNLTTGTFTPERIEVLNILASQAAISLENAQLYTQLEEYTRTLEAKVEERTAELKEAVIAADSANNAKSEFLSNMSHELRTPLNGILGYAQILRRSPTMSQQEMHGINIIQQCGEHLLTLINDVLDLSKIEARKMELYPTDFYFPSFLLGVAEICRIKAEQKDISFIYQASSDLPTGIRADEKRLRQVLINLLGNAIKFTDNGGVTFKVSVLENGTNSDQFPLFKIRFQVEDTGIGMNPEQLEKIFLPFEQVSETKRKTEGTGLGLAISQKIVELMGSTIQVKSQLGQGSVFWIDLDLLSVAGWMQNSTIAARGGQIIGFKGENRKILVVDDRWENRSVIVNLLSPIGFEIAEASNGEEGLEKAKKFQPHLIIIDLVMPVIDGFEMMRRLRQSEKLKQVVAIGTSASVYDSDRQNSMVAGADDFLPKPVQADDLFQKLQKHLQLEWIYEEKGEMPREKGEERGVEEAEPLAIPDLEELSILLDLAKKGRVKAILEQVERLERSHQKFVPFGQRIRQLAKKFQIPKIQQLLEKYMKND